VSRQLAVTGGFILASVACLVLVWAISLPAGGRAGMGRPGATRIEERLIPTALPETPAAGPTAVPRPPAPTATPVPRTPVPTPTRRPPMPAATPVIPLTPTPYPAGEGWRFGVVDRLGDLLSYDLAPLGAGWYLSGIESDPPPVPYEVAYIVGVHGGTVVPDLPELRRQVLMHPGALWQVGNEPDVIWQSNSTPEQYATAYFRAYTLIKRTDPSAQVAAGAISQPTPLRLEYLDRVLAAYEARYGGPMPVDAWALHNAILREERNSWGVDIPPGLDAETGRLYRVEDNADLAIFTQQLVDFRRWMRDRGYRDRPLLLTEFGVLMPAEYGFPPERVSAFMLGAFEFMVTAVDPELGYPPDGDRLVQRWAWYSLAATDYPGGNLYDPETKAMTDLGRAFAAYVGSR
jgi:hypothetical protein